MAQDGPGDSKVVPFWASYGLVVRVIQYVQQKQELYMGVSRCTTYAGT